jgi:hypothetical protein
MTREHGHLDASSIENKLRALKKELQDLKQVQSNNITDETLNSNTNFEEQAFEEELKKIRVQDFDSKTGSDLLAELKREFDRHSKELENTINAFMTLDDKRVGLWPKNERMVDKIHRIDRELAEDQEHFKKILEKTEDTKQRFLLPARTYVLRRQEYRCLLWTQSALIRNEVYIKVFRGVRVLGRMRRRF